MKKLFVQFILIMVFAQVAIAGKHDMGREHEEVNQTLVTETIEDVEETATPIWLSSVLTISLVIGLLAISYKYLRA